MVNKIAEVYKTLTTPSDFSCDSVFHALFIPNSQNIWLGKDCSNRPVLLIKDTTSTRCNPPTVLENISITHMVNCQITINDGTQFNETVSLIRCTTDSESLQLYFIILVSNVIELNIKDSINFTVDDIINNFIKLFRTATKAPRKTVYGLWAELFIIAASKNSTFMIDSWHSNQFELTDFTFNNAYLEIKATNTRLRKHHFSIYQLHPPVGSNGCVASLFVEPKGNGITISELVSQVRIDLDSARCLKLDFIVYSTLGEGWKTMFTDGFDYDLAKNSLRFYDMRSVPSILLPLPKDVTEVHFVSDLGNAASVLRDYMSLNALFENACPSFYHFE